MAWPVLIIAGAAVMAGAGIGASQEEMEGEGSILTKPYPSASTEEKLAADTLAELATKLYEDSNGKDPEFYKKVFEGLPETKMSDEARSRLAAKYKEVNLMADQKMMEQAGEAFGERMDSLVERGVMSPVQADKQKLQNEARIRSMMSILDKRWKATEIADARKMWVGDQRSSAQGVGVLGQVRAKNQALMNQAIDTGLKHAINKGQQTQYYQGQQMWANERVLQETRAAEFDFWGKMVFPGGGGGGGGGSGGSSISGPSNSGGMYQTSFGSPGYTNSYYPASYGGY